MRKPRVFLGPESMFCFGVPAAWQSPVLTTGQSRGDGGHSSCQCKLSAAREVTWVRGDCARLNRAGSEGCGKYRMCWFVCVFSLRPSAPWRSRRDGQSIPDFPPVCRWWLPPCTSRFPGLFSTRRQNNVRGNWRCGCFWENGSTGPEDGIVCRMNVDSALAATRTSTNSKVLPCLRLPLLVNPAKCGLFLAFNLLLVVNLFVNFSSCKRWPCSCGPYPRPLPAAVKVC